MFIHIYRSHFVMEASETGSRQDRANDFQYLDVFLLRLRGCFPLCGLLAVHGLHLVGGRWTRAVFHLSLCGLVGVAEYCHGQVIKRDVAVRSQLAVDEHLQAHRRHHQESREGQRGVGEVEEREEREAVDELEDSEVVDDEGKWEAAAVGWPPVEVRSCH